MMDGVAKWQKRKANSPVKNAGTYRPNGWDAAPDAVNGTPWWKKEKQLDPEQEDGAVYPVKNNRRLFQSHRWNRHDKPVQTQAFVN
ncbi:hypothetical protein JIR001_01420 [Polycladomyces abyssicola]|uniref:Uncharacterized protein n=1 Tax=Polycladomyces abyssicola TaxID=1125966 RepID=A0A8D5UC80_9BACL|nr:hypothetical protein JIR001_01420 [Polycladomyces abyssicola]